MRSTATTTTPVNRLTQITALIEPQLKQVAARIAEQAAAFDPAIEGYVSYALGNSGKQLRPIVALLAGSATGEIKPAHVELAVIIELVHLATLVHDDIMDEAERRRGLPTLNARWGNALSVLLGDSLFAHALDLSTRFDDPEITRAIARATRDVCTGEIIQTQRRFDLHLAMEEYFRIIEMKTATLFAVAAQLSAKLNGAESEHERALHDFGLHLGAAYQIYDDCLDVAGREQTAGKTLGTDLHKGKITLPMLRLLSNASEQEKERYCQLILEGDAVSLTLLLRTNCAPAMNESMALGAARLEKARAQLESLPPSRAREGLGWLVESIGAMLRALPPAGA